MTSESITLVASSRTQTGTAACRRLRREGLYVPAVVYGAQREQAQICLPRRELDKAMESEAFYTQVVKLRAEDGTEESVLVKAIQTHPAQSNLCLHIDFLRIDADQEVTMRIPLHFVNEENAHGVKVQGGVLTPLVNDIQVRCLPSALPTHLDIDVSELKIGETIHLSAVQLPADVALAHQIDAGDVADLPLVSIAKSRGEEDEGLAASEELGQDGAAGEGEASDEEDDK